MNIYVDSISEEKYFIATYEIESSTTVKSAAWSIAIGQSVGNPNVRNRWETEEIFIRNSCVIENNECLEGKKGKIRIGFPIVNTNFGGDGISHLLCQLMGGQLDIDIIKKCRLTDLKFPEKIVRESFSRPKYGIDGVRKLTNVYNKPLLGAIIKPKTGMSPSSLLEMVKELVDNGVNFIKEDEILSNPSFCSLKDRVPLISNYIRGKNVVYAVCINADPAHVLDRVRFVHDSGGNAIHINFWAGLGVYKSIRELDLDIMIHYQKSGDKILTNKTHDFGIDWSVLCYLAALSGVDFIHAGMWGGYLSEEEEDLRKTMKILHSGNVIPALSCGMHPGLVDAISKRFGIDYMANVGGAIHGHPNGTSAGVKAMRQAIDKDYGKEYFEAIQKWGIVE